MKNDIFMLALANKYRFNFKGVVSTEDLFDLKKEDLETIYSNLLKEKKEISGTSLFGGTNSKNEVLDNKIAILKEIANYKTEKEKEIKKEKEKWEFNRIINETIRKKKIENIEKMSIEELEKLKK
jgi:hypothetical protein